MISKGQKMTSELHANVNILWKVINLMPFPSVCQKCHFRNKVHQPEKLEVIYSYLASCKYWESLFLYISLQPRTISYFKNKICTYLQTFTLRIENICFGMKKDYTKHVLSFALVQIIGRKFKLSWLGKLFNLSICFQSIHHSGF